MERIYIASQVFASVTIAVCLPVGYQGKIERFADEGPAWIGAPRHRAPPRRLATATLNRLSEYPYHYSRDALDFLAHAPLGTWRLRQMDNGDLRWEPLEF